MSVIHIVFTTALPFEIPQMIEGSDSGGFIFEEQDLNEDCLTFRIKYVNSAKVRHTCLLIPFLFCFVDKLDDASVYIYSKVKQLLHGHLYKSN